jgi:hypothetical protein
VTTTSSRGVAAFDQARFGRLRSFEQIKAVTRCRARGFDEMRAARHELVIERHTRQMRAHHGDRNAAGEVRRGGAIDDLEP